MRIAKVAAVLAVLVLLFIGYLFAMLNWSYSNGERAGWVQKLSRKGWICKTWEGEMAMVTMPGSVAEKFPFTVHDDAVVERLNALMGRRVTLHYEEKVGLPTSCFGETRYFVDDVKVVEDSPLERALAIPPQPVPAQPAPEPQPAPPQ